MEKITRERLNTRDLPISPIPRTKVVSVASCTMGWNVPIRHARLAAIATHALLFLRRTQLRIAPIPNPAPIPKIAVNKGCQRGTNKVIPHPRNNPNPIPVRWRTRGTSRSAERSFPHSGQRYPTGVRTAHRWHIGDSHLLHRKAVSSFGWRGHGCNSVILSVGKWVHALLVLP